MFKFLIPLFRTTACLPLFLAMLLLSGAAGKADAQQYPVSPKALEQHKYQQKSNTASTTPVTDQTALRVATATTARPLTSREYLPDGTGWRHATTTTYTYDNSGQLTDQVLTHSNGSNLYWETYTYDQYGNETQYRSYTWAGAGWAIYESRQTDYTHDSNGRITAVIAQRIEGNNLVPASKREFTYSSNGDLVSETGFRREGTLWLPVWQENYSYASPNSPPVSITILEVDQNGVLRNNGRVTNLVWHNFIPIDNAGFINWEWESYRYQRWSDSNWEDVEKYQAAYTANNSYTGLYQTWLNGNWVNEWRTTTTYDEQGNNLLDQGEEWRNNDWAIHHSYKTSYTYNAANQVEEKTEQGWDRTLQRFLNLSRTTYSNYQTITSAAEAMDALLTEIYPNPSSGSIKVRLVSPAAMATVTVTDMTGKKVYHKQLSPNALQHELNLSSCPAGIYLLQLHSGSTVIQRKIIRQ